MQNNPNKNNQIIIYNTEDGQTKIEVRMKDETVWLSQKQMAELFDCSVENIIFHLKNVFESAELSEKATTKDYLAVQKEGNREIKRSVKIYNLDAIISVGYRINSLRGTQFRIWATQKLRDYIIKGFAMDDERLAEGRVQKTYFEEWEERIRRIRTSEANFYQKVRDVFATSADYNLTFNSLKDAHGEDYFSSRLDDEIVRNLNPKFELREYQKEALGRFDFYLPADLPVRSRTQAGASAQAGRRFGIE